MEDQKQEHIIPGIDKGKASDESVIRVHARARRTPVAASPVAFFTTIALIIVFVFAWFYVRRHFAGLDSTEVLHQREDIKGMIAWQNRPMEPEGPATVDGAPLYALQCVSCHQAKGQGLAGAFPPLAGSEWVTGEPELPIKILLYGLTGEISVAGANYNGYMTPYGSILSDAEIAGIVTYIRGSWDNNGSEVTEEQVAAIRAEFGTRGTWTPDELQEHF